MKKSFIPLLLILTFTPIIALQADSELSRAAENGNAEQVTALLAASADIHTDDDYALRWAALNGHTKTVKILLAAGANVHANEDEALCWAAERGHTESVKILLKAGADVHADDDYALRWAASYGHTETVKTLLAAGADAQTALIKSLEDGNARLLKTLGKYAGVTNVPTTSKLYTAIQASDSSEIKTLLEQLNGNPHKIIIQKALESRNPDIVRIFFENVKSLKNAHIIGLSKYYFLFTDGIIKVLTDLNKQHGNAYILAMNMRILKDDKIMSHVSGLLNPGNGDSFPRHYKPFQFKDLNKSNLRASEKLYQAILNYAKAKSIPYLGICSGAQHLALSDQGSLKRVDDHSGVWETVTLKEGTFPYYMALSEEEKDDALLTCTLNPVEIHDAKMVHNYAVAEGLEGDSVEVGGYSKRGTIEAISIDGLFNGVQFHPERSYYKTYKWKNRHKHMLDSFYSLTLAYNKSKQFAKKHNIPETQFQIAFKDSVKTIAERLNECGGRHEQKLNTFSTTNKCDVEDKKTTHIVWSGRKNMALELKDISDNEITMGPGITPEDVFISVVSNDKIEIKASNDRGTLTIYTEDISKALGLHLSFSDGSIVSMIKLLSSFEERCIASDALPPYTL